MENKTPQNRPRLYHLPTQGIFLAKKISQGTTGSLSIDLKRPQLATTSSDSLLRRRRRRRGSWWSSGEAPRGAWGWNGAWTRSQAEEADTSSQWRGGRGGTGTYGDAEDRRAERLNEDVLPNYAFSDAGARIKAMRHVRWGPKVRVDKYGFEKMQQLMDFGVGLEFEMDTAALHPRVRIKAANVVSFKLFPEPMLKVSKRVKLGTTDFAIRFAYECPLESINRFYAPPARFLITLDNSVMNGVRLTQSGVEFSVNRWFMDENVRLRANGVISLPSELPLAEYEDLVGFDIRRLGLKANW